MYSVGSLFFSFRSIGSVVIHHLCTFICVSFSHTDSNVQCVYQASGIFAKFLSENLGLIIFSLPKKMSTLTLGVINLIWD